MGKGDVIRVSIVRRADMGPEHFGVFDGDRGVYHFQGNSAESARVKWTTLHEFEQGCKARICSYYAKEFTPSEIMKRAESKITTNFGGYNLFTNNCEDFASWCVTGIRKSLQMEHVNREDDKRDIVEKAIDAKYNPYIKAGDMIDKKLGWGDYNEGEKSLGEEVFETLFINPIDKATKWLDKI